MKGILERIVEKSMSLLEPHSTNKNPNKSSNSTLHLASGPAVEQFLVARDYLGSFGKEQCSAHFIQKHQRPNYLVASGSYWQPTTDTYKCVLLETFDKAQMTNGILTFKISFRRTNYHAFWVSLDIFVVTTKEAFPTPALLEPQSPKELEIFHHIWILPHEATFFKKSLWEHWWLDS